eukprot:755293-Hanusia_phi.AAC.2
MARFQTCRGLRFETIQSWFGQDAKRCIVGVEDFGPGGNYMEQPVSIPPGHHLACHSSEAQPQREKNNFHGAKIAGLKDDGGDTPVTAGQTHPTVPVTCHWAVLHSMATHKLDINLAAGSIF